MTANAKRILGNMVYYTLIGVMVAFGIFFAIILAQKRMETYFQVGYYILLGALVGVVIFDIVCTIMKKNKLISGFILYALTIDTIIMSFIAYGIIAVEGIIAINLLGKFLSIISLSYIINILAIVIYVVGEKLVSDKQ